MDWMVNAAAVHLRLPASLNVHPTFHVLWVKPVRESALSPTTEDSPPQPNTVQRILGGQAQPVPWFVFG